KFDEKSKPPMKVDTDPLEVAEASFVEPFECNMVEAVEVVDCSLFLRMNTSKRSKLCILRLRKISLTS
ncbi:hypothetical protein A2U01_0105339, partial [Trifolium medium]|nr:hypothetical protein [Trifolium medium]